MFQKQISLLVGLFFTLMLLAQTNDSLPVFIRYSHNKTKDTLLLYVVKPDIKAKGSLLMVAHFPTTTATDSFYFPLLDTINLFALVIPDNLMKKNFQLSGYYYPGIFKIKGKVISKIKEDKINALVITANEKIFNKALDLDDLKEFSLPALVFEKKASLIFNTLGGHKRDHPNVSIIHVPSKEQFTQRVFDEKIVMVDTARTDKQSPRKLYDTTMTGSTNKNAKQLSTVVVKSTLKSKAEKYNEENSTGLFNDASERVIDCLDNNDILSYPDCLSYLRTKLPGMKIENSKFGDSYIMWRGTEMKAFFIDEMSVDIEQILSIPVSDIAIIKTYPPPFFGAGGNGNGGAIGVYTRKGDDRRPGTDDKKWIFPIRGYSSAIHVLFSK